MRKILTLIGAATLLAMPAQAQLGPIEDIIEDIIGDPAIAWCSMFLNRSSPV